MVTVISAATTTTAGNLRHSTRIMTYQPATVPMVAVAVGGTAVVNGLVSRAELPSTTGGQWVTFLTVE